VRVGCRGQAEWVGGQVAAGDRVVVGVVVVVQAGFLVGVLAGEPQRRGGATGMPGGAAPEGVLLAAMSRALPPISKSPEYGREPRTTTS
jgi:hypothetical protein